ncbi:MAG: AI-2E family transporter [Desulfobulbaceae bacterium]|nr:AI-2E family transporter [Desulfobulbaceae bacterium]
MDKNKQRILGFGVVKAAAWVSLVVLLTVIFKSLDFLLIPFSISLLFCYALGIPLEFLQRFKVPSSVRIIIVVCFIIASFYLLGRMVSLNVKEFYSQLPVLEEKFWIYATSILDLVNITPDEAREMYDSLVQSFTAIDLKPIGVMAKKLSGSFFSFLGNMFWVILIMIFMLAERDNFTPRIVLALGDERSEPVLEAVKRINKAVQSYLGLKTLISLLTGFLVAVSLALLQIPFALLWGVLAFLFNFIPNIGSLISVVPPVAITLFQFGSFSKAFLVAVILVAIQVIVGNFLEPKIMGKGLNLSPLVVLLSLVFWGWMWGIPGMLLSVPLTAAFKIACEQLDSTRPVAILMSARK